jgi:flagellar M-ring protein FliF
MNNDINFQAPDENTEPIVNGAMNPGEGTPDFGMAQPGARTFNGTAPETAAPGGGAAARGREIKEPHRFKMPERFSFMGIIKAFRDYWSGLESKTKRTAVTTAVLVLVLVIGLTVLLNRSPYERTYFDLDASEAGQMIAALDASGIPSRWDPALQTLSVRERDQARAVGVLAVQGFPRSGFMYEEEPQGGFMETGADRAARINRNRERRLQAALNAVTGVESSLVTLTVPDNSASVLMRERVQPSAAVALRLRPGFALSAEAVRGIENLIQRNVENLMPENITIIDNNGVKLNEHTGGSSAARFANVAEIRADFERRKRLEIRDEVLDFLAPVFGLEKIPVSVSVTSDFDDLLTEAIKYTGTNIDPDTGEQRGMVERTGQDYYISSDDPMNHGYAVADINPDSPAYFEHRGDFSEGRYHEEYHYSDERLVNRVVSQMQRTSPDITDTTVAITLDMEAEYLDYEFLDDFIAHIAMATGITHIARRSQPEDAELIDHLRTYISIMAIPFPPRPETGEPAGPGFEEGLRLAHLLVILGAAFIVLMILITFVIALLSRKSRQREAAEEERMAAAMATESVMSSDPSLVNSLGLAVGKHAAAAEENEGLSIEAKEQTLKRQIKMFAEQNPEISAQLIRTLIKGDEMPGG